MNRKTTLLLIAVILLGGIVYWLSKEPGKQGRQKYDYEFHIEDTASIGRILIRDKVPHEVNLVRTDEGWKIDGEKLARQKAAQLLVTTFHKMRLKNFVAESMKPTVLNRLATYGIEVQVFDRNDKVLRHFYVGTPTMDEMGSYMMNKGGDAPYAVFIPGFNGNLSTRFFADPILWRDRTIWGYDNLNIRTVRVRYANNPLNSFELNRLENNDYTLTRLADNEVFKADTIQSALYMALFSRLQYEGAIVETDKIWQKQDSLKSTMPAFDIYVENKNGEGKTLTLYRIKAPEDTEDLYGEDLEFDPNRYHAFITPNNPDEKEMFVLAQNYALRNVFTDIASLVRNF
ncbi:MAG: DUF4340 domain-containing protein [Flavobacteriales bacterium]|nr:MAG: DUF4340 domain-containing protein [Flavobacteriales bacterium]